MSLSANPDIKVIKMVENSMTSGMPDTSEIYRLKMGAPNSNLRNFSKNTISTNQLSFPTIVPGPATRVSKTVFYSVKYLVEMTGTCPPGSNLGDQYGYSFAPRALFVNNSISKTTVKINDNDVSCENNDLVQVITRANFSKLQQHLSESCTTVDNTQSYDETVGSSANPMASQFNVGPGQYAPRGAKEIEVLENTPTSFKFYLTGREPILVSPFRYDDVNETSKCFVNITSLDFSFTFDSKLNSRLLSVAESCPSVFSNVVVTPVDALLTLNIFSNSLLTPYIKPLVSYPYYKANRYIQNGQLLQSGENGSITFNNMILSSVPGKLYITLQKTSSSLGLKETQTFARIQSVSVSAMNNNEVLQTLTPYQLYEMSKKNGYDGQYSDWYGSLSNQPRNFSGSGSVLIIDPAKDLSLGELYTSGTTNQFSLQFTVNYTNIRKSGSAPMKYDCYVYIVNDGLCHIMQNSMQLQEAVVSLNDATLQAVPVEYTSEELLQGGSFWSDAWSGLKRIWQSPITQGLLKVAPILLGAGNGGGLVGGCDNYNVMTGNGLVGGKKLSKKRLMQLMK